MTAPQRFVSAASVLETSIVVERRLGEPGTAALDELLAALNAEIVPFDTVHVGWARRAFRKYGKSRHAAALNFGDCVAYATAKHLGLPLLFKGDDFPQTDIEAA